MAFAQGFAYGSATVLLIGPVLFTLLKASLAHGFRGGFAVALGIIVGDVIAVIICMSGWLTRFQDVLNQRIIAVAAGMILLLLGLKYVFRPNLDTSENIKIGTKSILGVFSAGFLVNFVNPFVFTVWIGLTIHTSESYASTRSQWLFMLGALVAIFMGDVLKAAFAPKLKAFLNERSLIKLYRVIGLFFIGFSIRAFLFSLQ